MNDQDRMARELVKHKSLEALSCLVSHGREVAFHVEEDSCFISRRRGVVCLWCGNEARQFDSAETLIRDPAFLSLWERAGVDTIF